MTKYDFIALDCLLRHSRNKKRTINRYPKLRGRSIKEIEWLIMANKMLMTGKSFKQQREKHFFQRSKR
jgi:hypothetical protein